jgi:hypothetical protein
MVGESPHLSLTQITVSTGSWCTDFERELYTYGPTMLSELSSMLVSSGPVVKVFDLGFAGLEL